MSDGDMFRAMFKWPYGRSALDSIKEDDICLKIQTGKYEGWVKDKKEGVMLIELTENELRYLYFLLFEKLSDEYLGAGWGGISRRLKQAFDESGLDPIKREKTK